MSTIVPPNEMTKKALAWICDEKEAGRKTIKALVEEASIRFNLGPKDEEFLTRFFTEQKD